MGEPESARPIVAPSLLSCDFSRIGEEIRAVEAAGADWLHVDVMDGHFVPNLTIGPPVVKAVRAVASIPLDVHLMVTHPAGFVEDFAAAGASLIAVHAERDNGDGPLDALFERIRSLGCRAGLSINPPTPVEWLLPWLSQIDLAVVMTVNPGFGGQSLISDCLEKVRVIREEVDRRGLDVLIEVDGGINAANIGEVLEAGADVIVAGNFVFRAPDHEYAAPIRTIRAAAAQRA